MLAAKGQELQEGKKKGRKKGQLVVVSVPAKANQHNTTVYHQLWDTLPWVCPNLMFADKIIPTVCLVAQDPEPVVGARKKGLVIQVLEKVNKHMSTLQAASSPGVWKKRELS